MNKQNPLRKPIPAHFKIGQNVLRALSENKPVVALETAVLTHGLPHPNNVALSLELETSVQNENAVPATIGFIDGKIWVGLDETQIRFLGDPQTQARKISRRDFGAAIVRNENGGTTVAGTLIAAVNTGIQVFATGGIGGVHRNAPFDISADLIELSKSPVIVVCSGAKSILDLPATLEYLETMGIPILGYQTNNFPAFYSTDSGLKVDVNVKTPAEVADIARAQWESGLLNGVLVVQPPPSDIALPNKKMEEYIQAALSDAKKNQIKGSATTPYLLARVSQLSGGESLRTNLALLRGNATLAAKIANHITKKQTVFHI